MESKIKNFERIRININQFNESEINDARKTITTADISNSKNSHSFFYKNEDGYLSNLDQLDSLYGYIGPAISQYILGICYSQAGKGNNEYTIRYKTIQKYFEKQFNISIQYISKILKTIQNAGIIKRYRISSRDWKIKLTELGYEWLFGCKPNSNEYAYGPLRTKITYLIYEWFPKTFRIFRSRKFNPKYKARLQMIKRVLLGIPFYKRISSDYLDNNNDDYNNHNQQVIKTSKGDLDIGDIFTDEDIKEIFR